MYTGNSYETFWFSEFWETVSPTFLSFYFVPFVLALACLYYLMPKKMRWIILLAGSVLFYASAGLHPLITVLLTAFAVWLCALMIASVEKTDRQRRKIFLLCGIGVLLAVLIFTKSYLLLEWRFPYVVPLGISYYTFSAIGYLADVYWGKDMAEPHFLKLLLFFLYFPKILQGPIARHKTLEPQFREARGCSYREFCFGMQLAVWGYFKKMVIADRIGIFTGNVFGNVHAFGGAVLLLGAVLSAVQIYCDFSGCMDIAAGVSQMFGISLEHNFEHPFFSQTVPEFWRRWHISLGTWFKDYVYMPLASSARLIGLSGWIRKRFGKRASRLFMLAVPSAVVWVLTGLWHGTGAGYLAWGAYWGMLVILSAAFEPELKKMAASLHLDTAAPYWKRIRVGRTFLLFCFSRLITVPGDLAVTGKICRTIWTAPKLWQLFDGTLYGQGLEWKEFWLMICLTGVLWMISLQQQKGSLREKIAGWNMAARCAVYACSVIIILVLGIYGPSYETSSFLYMNY